MKALAPDQLVELLQPTQKQLHDGLAAFEKIAPIMCRRPADLKHLVLEGWLNTNIVALNGRPAYLIGWHISADGGFWFDLIQTLYSGLQHEVCHALVEKLARQKGCRYMRMSTYRAGVVKWAEQLGYTPEAVILTKTL